MWSVKCSATFKEKKLLFKFKGTDKNEAQIKRKRKVKLTHSVSK